MAKQTVTQGMRDVERLAGDIPKDFRVWRANDSTSVIKFLVDKDREAAFRQTTSQLLDPRIPRARLIGPKWYAVKADWVEVPLDMDRDSGKVSKSTMERFGYDDNSGGGVAALMESHVQLTQLDKRHLQYSWANKSQHRSKWNNALNFRSRRNCEYSTEERSWRRCIRGRLEYRSPSAAPSTRTQNVRT